MFEKARRIQVLCPEAKILIIIRSQLDMLRSLYRDHPFDPRSIGYRPKSVSFSEWLEVDFHLPYGSLANTLLFHRVVSIYESLFSRDQVLVLPLELANKNRSLFVDQLSSFMEIDRQEVDSCLTKTPKNKGVSSLGNRYRRLRSIFAPYVKSMNSSKSFLKGIDKSLFGMLKNIGRTEDIKLSKNDVDLIADKFASGNELLAKQRDLSLKDLGYPFPE